MEMRGLATDHCPLHHLAVRVAEGLNAKISHIVIRRIGEGDDAVGTLTLWVNDSCWGCPWHWSETPWRPPSGRGWEL